MESMQCAGAPPSYASVRESLCLLSLWRAKMREGEKHFFAGDRGDRVLMISNSILTTVSIVLTVIDIVIRAMPFH